VAIIDVGLLNILIFILGAIALLLILVYMAISSDDEDETSN